MAETLLFSIAENALAKIASLILQEVTLAWGLNENLRKLEQTLITIKAVLLDAEEQQSQNRALQLWLARLKIICYDAEDILDELEYHALRKQTLQLYGNPIKNRVSKFFSSSNSFALRFSIGHRLKELSEKLDHIADQKSKFHLAERVEYRPVGCQQREMTDSLLRASKVIGRDEDKEIVLKFLMNIDHVGNSGSVSVIPIVGMGGMGKTTFTKLLYNDVIVNECFQPKIWICAFESFDKTTLMVNMIKSLTNQNLSHLDPDQLQTIIQDKLNGKKFLLVLDDVCSNDRYKWDMFREILEGGSFGSKIIVTTRSLSVAMLVGPTTIFKLKELSHAHCLSILKKWAFREGEEESYPHLMEIANDIVRKCRGLPLVVRTLGTLLYSKNDKHYWEYVRDNEIWKLEQSENNILPALRLSYDQMPSHLKPCFVICSLYPKGYVFNTIELGSLWMAHGLLRPSNDREDMDDTVNHYVKELHSRSFFQDLVESGNLYVFTMHDLVHDLALYLAQTETSLVTVDNNNISNGTRHIMISDKGCLDKKIPKYLLKENSLQTLIFPPNAEGPALESFLDTCISNCMYLRMLRLTKCSFELLPSSIGNLKHLRYLDLSKNTKLRRLPDSMCKLHNMLVLSINYCPKLEELPRNIRNLVNLRVLEISVKQKYFEEDGIWCLKSLRSLKIENCPNLEFSFESIQSLTSLRDLRIINCKNLVSLSRNLICLTALKILHIQGCNQLKWMDEEGDNQNIVEVSLEILFLNDLAQLEKLPRWVQKCSATLQSLCIADCEKFFSLPAWLNDFTELKSLVIYNCPMFHIWDEFSLMEEDDNQGMKRNLQNLIFSKLPQLETLPQWVKKYSKTLQKLRILNCKNFSSFPEWLQDFTSLNTLIIEGCQELRTDRHLYQIAHVPNTYITNYVEELDLKIENSFWPPSWI